MPRAATERLIEWFVKKYNVDVEEAALPVSEYKTIADFFVRELKQGARPIGEGLVSPVDGNVVQCGEIDRGRMLQAKGKTYLVGDLLRDAALGEKFIDGYWITLYLAPGDYHHIHSPVAGGIIERRYIPGRLWPVNPWSVANIADLFTVNERVATLIKTDTGLVAVVMVGATNVGAIALSYDNLVTNSSPGMFTAKDSVDKKCYRSSIPVTRGERLGVFNMGSTVIVLLERGMVPAEVMPRRGPIKYGETLMSILG